MWGSSYVAAAHSKSGHQCMCLSRGSRGWCHWQDCATLGIKNRTWHATQTSIFYHFLRVNSGCLVAALVSTACRTLCNLFEIGSARGYFHSNRKATRDLECTFLWRKRIYPQLVCREGAWGESQVPRDMAKRDRSMHGFDNAVMASLPVELKWESASQQSGWISDPT